MVTTRRLGQECQPFEIAPPDEALFAPTKVAIVSNGRYVTRPPFLASVIGKALNEILDARAPALSLV